MSGATTLQLLGPEGALSRALPGYEHRPEQLALAQAVERALAQHHYLLAEAGTGTGKTLAYLVPAALSGRRVVVSTATKNLQEQVFLKDIPLLRQHLGVDVDAACLKGRSNYLCQHRYRAFAAAPTFAFRDEGALWPRLLQWAQETATGDRAEAELPDGFSPWPEMSATPQTCLGTRCPEYETCFVTQARRRAEGASLVVVNHALFFADLALRAAQGDGVLPSYDAVIFDEAHALPDVVTEHFGARVSNHRFDELARDAQRALPAEDPRSGMVAALALKVGGVAERFFRAVSRHLGLAAEATVRVVPHALDPLEADARELDGALAALASFAQGADEPELAAVMRRSNELATDLDFVWQAQSADHVFWAEQRGRGVFIRAAPIDVSEAMRQTLYRNVDTAVFTSATLRVGDSFGFFARAMGLDPAWDAQPVVRRLAVDSPFDYAQQAALYMTPQMPEPNAPAFVDAVAEEVVALTELTGGRAFVLFTSLRNMEAVHARVRHRLPFQVLLQGERPKSALLDAFRQEPSVLFASQSFWEGVDVPGDALSLVIIDRLPFASPGDPLMAARLDRARANGEEPFSSLQLPAAALALRQGFGRLIRTRTDRGVVAVLDRRLLTRAYGRVFLESLPSARQFTERAALARWLHPSGAPPTS